MHRNIRNHVVDLLDEIDIVVDPLTIRSTDISHIIGDVRKDQISKTDLVHIVVDLINRTTISELERCCSQLDEDDPESGRAQISRRY